VISHNSIKKALFISSLINILIEDFNVMNINLYRNVMKLIKFCIALSNHINNRVKFIYNNVLIILIHSFLFFDFY